MREIPLMKDENGNIIYMDIPKEPSKLVVGKSGHGMSRLYEHYANMFRRNGYKVFMINDLTNSFKSN